IPSFSQIAAEAGCSPRSIFEHFTDREGLNIGAADYAIVQGATEMVERRIDGNRAMRIRGHVEAQSQSCERWQSVWRFFANQHLPELRQRIAMVRYGMTQRMTVVYQRELSVLSGAERTDLLVVLATLVSFESWDQMRHCHDLSIDAARAVWRS